MSQEEKKNREYWEKESDDGQTNRQTDRVSSCRLDPFCVNYQTAEKMAPPFCARLDVANVGYHEDPGISP